MHNKHSFLLNLLSAFFLIGAILSTDLIYAQAKKKPVIKSVDLTLPVPKPGQSLFDAREFQLTSAKTDFGDLAKSGTIQVMELDFKGDFNENDDGDMFFRDGFTYKVLMQFMIDPNGPYTTDYVFTGNDYYIDGAKIKAKVNGNDVKVLNSTPYFINTEFNIKVGSAGAGSEKAMAQLKKTDYELNKNSSRASLKAYSIEQADYACPDTNPFDLIVITDNHKPSFFAINSSSDYKGQDCMRVTKILVDTPDTYVASEVNNTICGPYNIREVWISDKVDAVKFMLGMFSQLRGGFNPKTGVYNVEYSMLFHSKRATLFVPESAVPAMKARISGQTWKYPILFTIRTYSGDVYSAQRAGAKATKPFCTQHVYTKKSDAVDYAYKYSTCTHSDRYYYSCKICGHCEHNPNHLFSTFIGPEIPSHDYNRNLADEQAYVGENAAGQHVWWSSCICCGHSQGYNYRHITKAEWKGSGNDVSYEYFCKFMKKNAEDMEEEARLLTTAFPGMFILQYKSDAKTSKAYQSVVNYALNDNLLDDEVLGKDYTVQINNYQLRSLAVRLAEELLGHKIKVGKKIRSMYSDDYVAKAVTIGVLDAPYVGPGAPSDTDLATKKDVATVIYRTLRFIERQGLYCYSTYDSRLKNYTDHNSIAEWAEEAVAFMDAFALVKSSSKTTFAPDALCTIEEAIEVAQKSTHAHQLGWYQARSWDEDFGRTYSGHLHISPSPSGVTPHFISPGERVWVVGPRLGDNNKFLPVIDSYTGQELYIDAEWFRPVRQKVFTQEHTIIKNIEFEDYFDGVYMWDKSIFNLLKK